jgi:MFS family permease
MMGAANIWWVPLANTFGRRPVNLFNILLLMFSSVWAGKATSFESLLAARFFMGVGVGPADTSMTIFLSWSSGLVLDMADEINSCAECYWRDLFHASAGKSYGMFAFTDACG